MKLDATKFHSWGIKMLLVGSKLSEELNYRMSPYFAHFKCRFAKFVFSVVCGARNKVHIGKLIKLRPIIIISQLKMCTLPNPRPNVRAGEVKYFQTRHFFQKISTHSSSVIFTAYFDLKNTNFLFSNGEFY